MSRFKSPELKDLEQALAKYASSEKAAFFPRFFKTGKGQYGEGDVFIGVTVPNQRLVAKKFKSLSWEDIESLLNSTIHEHRLTALLILVSQYETGSLSIKKWCVEFYLNHLDRVNNWDLVDCSAHKILGDFLVDKDRAILYELARSGDLWRQRVAIVATWAFIRKKQFQETMEIAQIFLTHKHDLIHKAAGWMLREVGKQDEKVLINFLIRFGSRMPRTMWRYAIEKLDKDRLQNELNTKEN